MSKITEEELKTLTEQEQKKAAIIHDIGFLETQKHSLNHFFSQVVKENEDSKKELEKKYGKISVDLKDGGSYVEVDEVEEVEDE